MVINLKKGQKVILNKEKDIIQVRMDAECQAMLENLMNYANETNRSKMIRNLIRVAYVQNIKQSK